MLAAALLAGCAGKGTGGLDQRLARLQPGPLYERAHKALLNQDYEDAIRSYEALTARYPFAPESRQARIDIIYAYYRRGEKESALDAADTFIRENPSHPRIDYAYYLKGLIDFERTPYRFERWLRVDLTERPPSTAQKSFQAFRTVVEQYPKSAYAEDARMRMIYLRNRLADYDLNVADYYQRRGAYVAAARRAAEAIERYDGAPAVQRALAMMVECYKELGYDEAAANAERVYRENYPESPLRPRSGKAWWHVW